MMMMLIGERHWATVNRFIAMRLDKDVHARVVNLFPKDKEGLAALDPEILLQQIEERLVTTDQTEQKRLRFESPKQVLEEDPWKYKNQLQRFYDEAHVQDQTEFMEVYRRGIYNQELRKLLMLHKLPLTSIESLKAAAQHYHT